MIDLLVIGGGINGAGIARDAAGRGLSVTLVEQGDLAAATSSWSSKLIHGGLRYLEQYEFGLVREALQEREVLLRLAPHIIRPLMFVLPYDASMRPVWMIRVGLWMYDHLGGRITLPRSKAVGFPHMEFSAGLKPDIRSGFVYSDCRVDDSRLVVVNAMSARDKGAKVLTRTRFEGAKRSGGGW
ncbi:MAG: FAD-dependent oxidoreductase, partial [Usitatibacter sp.]